MSRHHRYESGKGGQKPSASQASDHDRRDDAGDDALLTFDGASRLRASIKVVGVGGGAATP